MKINNLPMSKEMIIGIAIFGALALFFLIRYLMKQSGKPPVSGGGGGSGGGSGSGSGGTKPRESFLSASFRPNLQSGQSEDFHLRLRIPKDRWLGHFELNLPVTTTDFPEVTDHPLFEISFIHSPDSLIVKGVSRAKDGAGNPFPIKGPVLSDEILKIPVLYNETGNGSQPMDGTLTTDEDSDPWELGKLPPLKKSDAIRHDVIDFVGGPSWDRFLRMLDIATVAGMEEALKAGYRAGIKGTREAVEREVNDSVLRQEILDDLDYQEGIMKDRLKATFDDIFSVTDFGKMFEPPPGSEVPWYLMGDSRKWEFDSKDPALEFENEYNWFEHPKARIRLGNLQDAIKDVDVDKLFFKELGFAMDIFEEKASLTDPGEDGEEPFELKWRRSRMKIELSVEDLLKDDTTPSLRGELNYQFRNRPDSVLIFTGVAVKTDPGFDDIEFDVHIGLGF